MWKRKINKKMYEGDDYKVKATYEGRESFQLSIKYQSNTLREIVKILAKPKTCFGSNFYSFQYF